MNKTSQKNIDDLLHEAMNSEIEAETFYRKASEKAQSQAGKNLFKELADFEHNHFEHVNTIIESRKKGIKIEKPVPHREMPEIKPEVEGEFEPNKDEIVEVLDLGIKAEEKARERYQKIAAQLDDPEGKEIFQDLAEDERRHHDLLEAQYYHMSNKGMIIWGE
jgi:rubrerythrin